MENIEYLAINSVNKGLISYCKFLSANDTGGTGGHQAGIYMSKNAISIMFDKPGVKGENKERFIQIKWQDDFITNSRFKYYGKRTRDEYRITKFGRGFPYLQTEHTGDLFVLVKNDVEDYSGYILQTEDEIDTFLDAFALSPTDTGCIIQTESTTLDTIIELSFENFINSLDAEFPSTTDMALSARRIYYEIFNHQENVRQNPDTEIISWIDMEFRLFRKIEHMRYGHLITDGFRSVDDFIALANSVLNRRKNRAGKSLEYHLSAVFEGNDIVHQTQVTTEGKKKTDFIFPSESAYHDLIFPSESLIFILVKPII